MVELFRTCYQVSIRRAAQTLPGPRSTLYYRSRKPEQAPLRHRIQEIAAKGPPDEKVDDGQGGNIFKYKTL